MRARAALAAALCGFVTVGAVIECQAGVQAVAATVEKIEPSPSRFPECIQVVDFPDNAESMGASAQSCEMFGIKSLIQKDSQVSRRAIQEDSCCTQNGRHGRQYDCAERDPKFLMFGKKTIESSEPPWPIISALVFFIVAPALGLVLGCSDRRRMRRLGIGILSAWCLGLLGIGALVGLG